MLNKIIIISTVILCLSQKLNAQTDKGSWLIGGNIKFSKIDNSTVNSSISKKETHWNINPYAGFFIKNKVNLGIKTSFSQDNNLSGNVASVFTAGPFSRYYFLPNEEDINLFFEACYQISRYRYRDNSSVNAYSYSAMTFAVGGVAFINEFIGIELSIERCLTKNFDTKTGYREFNIKSGLQVFLF